MSNNREKDKKDKISRHWCGNLGSSVILMQSGGESRGLSSHLCGGEGAPFGKNFPTGEEKTTGEKIKMEACGRARLHKKKNLKGT